MNVTINATARVKIRNVKQETTRAEVQRPGEVRAEVVAKLMVKVQVR